MKPIDPKTPRWEPTPDPNDIVVPGLDTTAPPYDQIEQIEQLITIKLQNIDANFSKIQQVMANRILPAVRKYSVGTQPVREAAKFWTTFYEHAAQIRIPTYDDYGADPEQHGETDQTETTHTDSRAGPSESSVHSGTDSDTDTPHAHRTFESDRTPSEVSFAPSQGAISSTPATAHHKRSMNAQENLTSQASEPMPSWNASLESPLSYLNREVQSLSEDRSLDIPSTSTAHRSEAYDASEDVTQRAIRLDVTDPSLLRSLDKGKGREGSHPLLHNVLRRNAHSSAVTSTSTNPSRNTSPLRVKPKTPILKSLNPYLPLDSNPSEWKGVVDLKDLAVASPQRNVPSSAIKLSTFKPSNARNPARGRPKTPPPVDDDSFDENFGMSPPVMTDYARLPKLGQTPKKVAAKRIMQSLLDVERRSVFAPAGTAHSRPPHTGQKTAAATEYAMESSSMSTISTPPSMTRYTQPSRAGVSPSETSGSVAGASLDSIVRRVGLKVPGYDSRQAVPLAPALAPVPPPAPAASRPPVPVFSSMPVTSSLTSMRSSASTSDTLQPPPPPQPEPIVTPKPPQYDYYDNEVIGQPIDDDADDDSMDSFDYDDGAQAPDFLFAPQEQEYDDDDSFDSSMDDDEEPTDGTAPPFIVAPADDGDFDDDSFDDQVYGDGEEETVFGVPPAQRLQQQAQAGGLRMLGADLLQDTIGIGPEMAFVGRVDESPTPWNHDQR